MPTRYLGDDGPPSGQPIDINCPKCGGVVYKAPYPPYLGSKGGYRLSCSKCDWQEEREGTR